jgi:hypothetical protein
MLRLRFSYNYIFHKPYLVVLNDRESAIGAIEDEGLYAYVPTSGRVLDILRRAPWKPHPMSACYVCATVSRAQVLVEEAPCSA